MEEDLIDATPPAAATGPRLRAFAGAVMLASLLAGVGTAMLSASMATRTMALVLTAAAWAVGWEVVAGRRPRRFAWLLLLGSAVGGLWGFYLARSLPSVPMRNLQIAAMLCYGAIALAAILRVLRVTDDARALLLTFSVAVTLFIADTFVKPPPVPRLTPWKVSMIQDEQVGSRYAPHSVAANYYPDNPRGYFHQTDPVRETWSLETHEGSEASLEPSATPGGMRVTIAELGGTTPWFIKLQQKSFHVRAKGRYVLSFLARADAPRRIRWTVGQNEPPWELRAPYWEADLETAWKTFDNPFVATATDTNVRIFFDLGGSKTALDIANVSLRDQATGRDIAPTLKTTEYFISYRFNALGFRGPDYVVPQPAGTFRILALGDSYTLGVGVHEQDTFSAQLESRLNGGARERPAGLKYEVINAGVSGYDTRQERLTYELHASAYTPQVVLLMMVYNDDLAFMDEARLGLVPSSTDAPFSPLWSRVQAARRPERSHDYTGSLREVLELNEACRRRNAKLAVAIFRNSRGFKPWADLVEAATEGLKGTGIPLLDLQPALFTAGRTEGDLEVHRVDGHPNEVAHRIASEAIEQFLRAQKLIQ